MSHHHADRTGRIIAVWLGLERIQCVARTPETLTRLILKMKRVRCHGTGDSVADGRLGMGGHGDGGGGSPGPRLRAGVGLLVQLVHLVQVGWTQETGRQRDKYDRKQEVNGTSTTGNRKSTCVKYDRKQDVNGTSTSGNRKSTWVKYDRKQEVNETRTTVYNPQ